MATDPVFAVPQKNPTDDLQRSIFTIALQQVLGDETILERNRRIFVEVAINGRHATEVAKMFGVERNNVDQIKARILRILQNRVSEIAQLVRDD